MAIREFRWVLVATTALVALSGPAWAQSAPTGDQIVSAPNCTKASKDPNCKPQAGTAAANGSTYLTPLVVSGAADSGGVGDPYATPASVSTIGGDEINQFGGQNLDNVLRATPGTFARYNPQQPAVAANIRGFEGSGRVNMEIDGARQNFRFTGHEAQGFTYVDPALLEGIDITRGASDGVGGAGALAGIVNFRTIGVDDLLQNGRNFGGFTSITAGTNGDGVSEVTAAADRINDTFAVLGAISKRNPQDYQNGDGDTVPYTAQDVLSGLVKAEITPSADQKLTLSGLDYNDNFTANGYNQTVNNQTYSAHYDYVPEDNLLVDLHAGVYYNDTRMHYNSAAVPGPFYPNVGRDIDDRTWGVNATNTSRGSVGDLRIKSTYGFEYSHDAVDVLNSAAAPDSTGPNPTGSSSLASVFDSTALSRGIVDLTGGLRYDYYDAQGVASGQYAGNPLGLPAGAFDVDQSSGRLDPSVTLALNPTDWFQPYVNYSQTFRPPTINELLAGGSHPGESGEGVLLPNPYLQPETSKGWEVGANFRQDNLLFVDDSARLKVDYFYDNIDNYVTAQFGDDGSYWFGNNPGTSHVQGVEVQAAYDAGWGFGSLDYTHIHTDLPTQVNGLGAESYMPDDVLTATIGGRFLEQRNLTIGTRFYAVSQSFIGDFNNYENNGNSYMPGYSLVDLFANYKFGNGVELGANVSNVFNVSYTPALSYTPDIPVPSGRGRTFEVSLKATF